jgi:hypothetical protein
MINIKKIIDINNKIHNKNVKNVIIVWFMNNVNNV